MKTKEEQAKKIATELLERVEADAKTIEEEEIEDHEDYVALCDLLFEAAEVKKLAAEREAELVAEEQAVIDAVDEVFAPLTEAYKQHETALKEHARDYAIACEERYKAMLEKAAKLAKSDPKKARELNAKAEDELAPKVKGIAFVSKMEAKVLDLKKVPKEYFKLVLDDAKLKAAAEAGTSIPGVVFEDVRTVRVTPSQRANGEGK